MAEDLSSLSSGSSYSSSLSSSSSLSATASSSSKASSSPLPPPPAHSQATSTSMSATASSSGSASPSPSPSHSTSPSASGSSSFASPAPALTPSSSSASFSSPTSPATPQGSYSGSMSESEGSTDSVSATRADASYSSSSVAAPLEETAASVSSSSPSASPAHSASPSASSSPSPSPSPSPTPTPSPVASLSSSSSSSHSIPKGAPRKKATSSRKKKSTNKKSRKRAPSTSDSDSAVMVAVDPNTNATGKSTIHPGVFKAAYKDILHTVKEAVEANPSLVTEDTPDTQTTLLHHAACGGAVSVVKYLLEAGAEVDAFDIDGYSALHYAAMYNQVEIIELLLDGDGLDLLDRVTATVNKIPSGTALFHAVTFNQFEASAVLIKFGADLKLTNSAKETVLHLATRLKRKKVVNLILDQKFKIVKSILDKQDRKLNTALHLAVKNGSLSVLNLLLAAKAAPNHGDEDGCTPLHVATKLGHFDQVKALITANAKPNKKDDSGRQPLDYASELGHADIQYYLVNSGADIEVLYNGKNAEGKGDPSIDPRDQYGFYINHSLYKQLIVAPNALDGRAVKTKAMNKYIKAAADWKKTKKNKSKMSKLRKGLIKGELPDHRRKALWAAILSEDLAELKAKVSYEEELKKPVDLKWIVQIDKDIERCLRIHETYSVRYGNGQCRLFRLLRSYTAYDSETRYTQGMSTLAAILLLQVEDEETAFFAFVALFEKWNLHNWYKNDLEGLRTEVFVTFTILMEKHLSKSQRHLTAIDVNPSFYLTQWCLELFFGNLPYELMIRFWDLYLAYGPNTFYGMSLALLKLNQADLLASIDMEGIHSTLKENPSKGLDYDKILKVATKKKWRFKQKTVEKLLAKAAK